MRRALWFHKALAPIMLSVMLVTLSSLWGCAKTMTLQQPELPQSAPGGIRFTLLAPGAKRVAVVGSFNGWAKHATPMTLLDGVLWSVTVPLKSGEHTFMYLIDESRWVTPPQAEDFVTDGFGQTNGVVIVR